MSKPKRKTETYRSDGTMPNNDYGDYRYDDTATLEKFPVVSAYVAPTFLPVTLLPEPPSQASSDPKPVVTVLSPLDARFKLSETCLQKAKEYLAKNDPMQASEKLYKAMEESIKFLAEFHTLSEAGTAEKNGKWSTGLLGTSAKKLTERLSKNEIDEARTQAWDAHVQGFHENKYGTKEVASVVPYVEWLVKYVQEVNDARRKGNP